ncbi:MAG: hypothetical protein ABIJ25_02840 [Pseudomonadota bacterium]
MDELAQQSSERLPQGNPPGETAIVQCSFCRGSGKDPFGIMSYLSTCCVCAGKGVVRVTAPYRPCPHCRGTGAVKTFTCTVCRGTGYVPQTAGPSVVCPECRGTGDDTGAPAMDCLKCRGLGLVPG